MSPPEASWLQFKGTARCPFFSSCGEELGDANIESGSDNLKRAEKNEVWQERKYLDMDEFNDWLASQNEPDDSGNVIAISA